MYQNPHLTSYPPQNAVPANASELEATNAEATGGAPNNAAAPSPRAWKLDAAMGGIDDDDDEDDEFVDEESLLTEEDLAPPATAPGNQSVPMTVSQFPSIFWFDFL